MSLPFRARPRSWLLVVALAACSSFAARADEASTPTPPSAPAATTPAAPSTPAEAAQPAEPAAPAAPPKNRDLETAKKLVAQHRIEAALKELDIAAKLPGNTDETVTEIAVVRSEALLSQKHPAEFAARGLILQVLHRDPEGKLFDGAPPEVSKVVDDLKANHPLVLHDQVKQSEPGRPVRIRARVVDSKSVVKTLTLHMKGHSLGAWTTDAMTEEAGNWTGYIRDPSVLAPPGVTDGFEVDYFLSAEDASGQTVDTNGAEDAPLELEISSTQVEEKHVDLAAIELHDQTPAAQPAPSASWTDTASRPWWQRWYTLTGAGVVVVGAVVAVIVVANQPKELDAHVGILHLP